MMMGESDSGRESDTRDEASGSKKILPEMTKELNLSGKSPTPEAYLSRWFKSYKLSHMLVYLSYLFVFFRFQENSWQFCSTITFFQILFIVLFGLFVKYDDEFHLKILNTHDPVLKAHLIAAQVCSYRVLPEKGI